MAQAKVESNRDSSTAVKRLLVPTYRLAIRDLRTGEQSELPPVPEFPDGLPVFCQLAAVGSELVVLGGLDPSTFGGLRTVFVYDFVLAKWRRGADMPGAPRSFFGCASDGERIVYVAGGHDDEKNALRSAMAYDVAKDEWVPLPDMSKERDECKGIFHGGKFHVIGGYCTEAQGRFERSAETFDLATWQWDPVQEDFLGASVCPRTCVEGDDGRLYLCRDGDVAELEGDKWHSIAKLPAAICNTTSVMTWRGNLLVIGSARFGEPHVAYVLDLVNHTWKKLENEEIFSGHVQSSCFVEI